MKIQRIVLLCLAPFLVEILVACCTCEVDETYEFTYNELTIGNVDNNGRKPFISSAKEIVKTAYAINLSFTTLHTASLFLPHFITSAKAAGCACPPPYRSDQEVKSLKIITVKDFNETHKAGSDVSEYFKLFMYSSYVPISNLVNDSEAIFYYFDGNKSISINLFLMTAPQTSSHQFQIEMEFTGGKIYKKITPVVNLI